MQRSVDTLQDRTARAAEIEDLENMTVYMSFGPSGWVLTWFEGEDPKSPFSFANWLRKLEIRAVKHSDGTLDVSGAYDPSVCQMAATRPMSPKTTRSLCSSSFAR